MSFRAGLLATVLLAFTSLAGAQPSWLLNHQEFVRLTPPEQKAYVRDVQRVFASLPERGRAFASRQAPHTPSKRQIASSETEEAGANKGLHFTAGEDDDDTDPKTTPSLAEAVGARPPPKPSTFGEPTLLKDVPASAGAAAPSAAHPEKSVAATGPFYRCMYSGFVLKHDPCKGPRELPDDVKVEGIPRASLVCKPNQVLCNPLLFGLNASCDLMPFDSTKSDCLAKATPLCISRSVSATSDCAARSTDQNVSAAAALITTNSAAWNDYLTSFYELCDDEKIAVNEFAEVKDGAPREVPERTRNDIRQTCGYAKEQLTRITQKYRAVETKRPDKPAETSKGQK